ncbi:SUKH-4 family immunity protein [Xanthocytophaga agilis]|uniref:SUKH-4 family immunity protein n=1 Tax=Xanthocytophaga agilis TaxID=3048010 RepID=A0AAE3R7C4_9BACT|nr:SUKH-4 family immunity protein [Xanthocytophaga agilis]MDJ1502789.1 SUKH-4 family immunity protein [Xanthocytophaga agilis]
MPLQKVEMYHEEISYEVKKYSFNSEYLSFIPIDIRVYLEKIGLPSVVAFDALSFTPYSEENTIITGENRETAFLIVGKLTHFYCDFGLQVYLNLKTRVVMIDDPYSTEKVLFANADFFAFVNFVTIYLQQIILYIDMSDNEISMQNPADWLVARFNAIDPLALSSPENFWTLFIDAIKRNYNPN